MSVKQNHVVRLNIEEAARPSQTAWTLERNHDYWMRAAKDPDLNLPGRCYELAGVWWYEIVQRFGPLE